MRPAGGVCCSVGAALSNVFPGKHACTGHLITAIRCGSFEHRFSDVQNDHRGPGGCVPFFLPLEKPEIQPPGWACHSFCGLRHPRPAPLSSNDSQCQCGRDPLSPRKAERVFRSKTQNLRFLTSRSFRKRFPVLPQLHRLRNFRSRAVTVNHLQSIPVSPRARGQAQARLHCFIWGISPDE